MEFQPTLPPQKTRGFRERDAEQNRLDHSRDTYYNIPVSPADMSGWTAPLAVHNSVPCIQFATGVTDLARFAKNKPELWRHGKIRTDIWWTTNGTSTGAVDLDYLLVGNEEDVTTGSGGTTLYNATISLTPNGTAYIVNKTSVESSANIEDTHKLISGEFERDATADANTNGFFIFRTMLKFLPVHRQ